MKSIILSKLPFLAAPLLIAAGFVTLFAAMDSEKGTGEADGVKEPPKQSAADIKELAVDKQRNILVILDYLNDMVVERTKNHIYPAQVGVETTSRVLSKHTCIVSDPFIEQYCVDMLQQYEQIDNFYVADARGSFTMASKLSRGIQVEQWDRRKEEAIYFRKLGGRVVERMTEKERKAAFEQGRAASGVYDPRVRPWYKAAQKEKRLCWSEVYIFESGAGNGTPGFTASCPTFDLDGKLLFVTGADFQLKNISGFLRETKVGSTGIVCVLNGKRELIAYPDESKVVKTVGDAVMLAKAQDVFPPWARPALELSEKGEEKIFFFDFEARRYIASFAPFLPASGNDWTLAVLVPEEEFFNIEVGPRKD